jgi:hypothetical protein
MTTPGPKKRRRKLTIAETREQMAVSGDIDGLFSLLSISCCGDIDWEATFKLLTRAITVRSQRDPAAFVGEMYHRMHGFVSFLVLRSHICAGKLIAQHDRSMRGAATAELPRSLETVLPQLIELQQHLSEIASAQASTARSWALARGKQLANESDFGLPPASETSSGQSEAPEQGADDASFPVERWTTDEVSRGRSENTEPSQRQGEYDRNLMPGGQMARDPAAN